MTLQLHADREGQVASEARRAAQARYLPIAEHGLIGDLHTVALVGTDGTIDWYPRSFRLHGLRFPAWAQLIDGTRDLVHRITTPGSARAPTMAFLITLGRRRGRDSREERLPRRRVG